MMLEDEAAQERAARLMRVLHALMREKHRACRMIKRRGRGARFGLVASVTCDAFGKAHGPLERVAQAGAENGWQRGRCEAFVQELDQGAMGLMPAHRAGDEIEGDDVAGALPRSEERRVGKE